MAEDPESTSPASLAGIATATESTSAIAAAYGTTFPALQAASTSGTSTVKSDKESGFSSFWENFCSQEFLHEFVGFDTQTEKCIFCESCTVANDLRTTKERDHWWPKIPSLKSRTQIYVKGEYM